MNPGASPPSPAGDDLPPFSEELLREALSGAAAMHDDMAVRFADLLSQVVARAVGDGPQARAALDSGGFTLEGCVVALRHNADTHCVECFCDVGLPLPRARDAALQRALEINLCRHYPGLVLGLHPTSGRLVATIAAPLPLLDDATTCLDLLRNLALQVQRLRREPAFELDGAPPGDG